MVCNHPQDRIVRHSGNGYATSSALVRRALLLDAIQAGNEIGGDAM
jgi:hypothetical protein